MKTMFVPAEKMSAPVWDAMIRARMWAERSAAHRYVDSDLTGMCALASAKLFTLLKENGIEDIELIETHNDLKGSHCFVLYKDQYILDVTATQFGWFDQLVVVDRCQMDEEPYYWEVQNVFHSVRDLRMYQKKTGWPEYQIAKVK